MRSGRCRLIWPPGAPTDAPRPLLSQATSPLIHAATGHQASSGAPACIPRGSDLCLRGLWAPCPQQLGPRVLTTLQGGCLRCSLWSTLCSDVSVETVGVTSLSVRRPVGGGQGHCADEPGAWSCRRLSSGYPEPDRGTQAPCIPGHPAPNEPDRLPCPGHRSQSGLGQGRHGENVA